MHVTQICQYIKNGNKLENLAPPLSEEMWIEEDGTPYVYYSNPDNQNRYQKYYYHSIGTAFYFHPIEKLQGVCRYYEKKKKKKSKFT